MVATLSAEMLRTFEHLPDLYLILSPELEILTVSNTYLEHTFLKREELVNRPVLEAFTSEPGSAESETLANLQTSLRQVLKTRKPHQMAYQRYDLWLENGTQAERYWLPLNYPVLDAQGEISYIIHKVEEVTEQVKADLILETADGAFIQLDKNYRILFINKTALGLLSKTESDLVSKILWEEFPQAIGGAGYQAITKACTQKVKVETEFFSPIFERWVYLSAAPTHNGLVLFFYDRQDIKETQLRLQKSETLLREAEKVARTGSYEVDLLTNAFTFSDGLYQIFGEEPNSFTPSLEFIDSRSNPEDAAKVRKVLEQAATDKKPYFYTRRILHKDGSWRTVESHGHVITNGAGEAIKFLGVVQDVTERKKIENALKASEEEFRLFVTASSEVVYKMSPDWKEMYQLDGKNFLYSVQETSQNWMDSFIPVGERSLVETSIAKAIQTKTVFDLEHRVNKADGAIGWTHSRAIPMLDEKGEITIWIGTASDITERKEAEQRLKENKDQFEAAINVSPVALGFLKSIRNGENEIIDFLFYWVSKSGKELAQKDLTGRQLLNEFPFVRGTGLLEKFVNTVEANVPTDSEDHYQTETTDIWLRWKAVKLDDGLFISVEDITPRKNAEQEIVKNLAVLKQSEEVAQI